MNLSMYISYLILAFGVFALGIYVGSIRGEYGVRFEMNQCMTLTNDSSKCYEFVILQMNNEIKVR